MRTYAYATRFDLALCNLERFARQLDGGFLAIA
jgi:hypothetical protein